MTTHKCWQHERLAGYCEHKVAMLPTFMFNAHRRFRLYPGVPDRVLKAIRNSTRYNIPTGDDWHYFDDRKVQWKLSCFDHFNLCY